MARMKIKDVEKAMADGTLVAVRTNYGMKPATVLAVRQPRRVYSGARYDIRGHMADDGIKVRYTAGRTGVPSEEQEIELVIAPTDVLGPYDVVSTTVAAHRQREEERKDALERRRLRAEEVARRCGGSVVPVIPGRMRGNFTVTDYVIELTIEQAEAAR